MQPKIFGKKASGKELQKIATSPNFKNGVFINPIPTSMSVDPLKVMKDYFRRNKADGRPKTEVPYVALQAQSFMPEIATQLNVRWLGHASSIIELDGIRILTDPVFSERVSPFGFMGPKRMHPSPLPLSEIPKVDLVIISHNHYDHLDYEFILALKNESIKFVVPLGVGAYLQHWGVSADKIEELDWHDSFQYQSVSITATPARHFTGRGVLDRNKSFWASFAIKGAVESIFFCGDSGFFKGFEAIGSQYGPFDITMIGIGAYNEQWQSIHTNPEEAIEAHHLLNGKHLLPIHWCTFDLAPHHWQEPIEWLVDIASKRNTSLLIPIPGTSINAQEMSLNTWWR